MLASLTSCFRLRLSCLGLSIVAGVIALDVFLLVLLIVSLSLSLNSFLVPTPLFCRILQPKREGDDASVGESEPGRLAVVEHEGSGAVALGVLDLELGLALDQR